MFTLSELSSLNERQMSYRLLKPWWEVFMDYLVVLMLMVSVLAGTLLLSRDGVVCLPSDPLDDVRVPNPLRISPTSQTPPKPSASPTGRRTHLDYQQYVYISQVCYHEALPWYSRFFPYVALLHSLVLMASGCFWFHFPRTSARIEHFVVILGKCAESPWTSRALSLTAQMDSTPSRSEEPVQLPSASRSPSLGGRSSRDSGTDSPAMSPCLNARSGCPSAAAPPSPCPSTLSCSSSVSLLSFSPPRSTPESTKPPGDAAETARLDRSDREQARALFERVRRFRAHCEASDVIYKVYVGQTVFKALKTALIMSYTAPLLGSISFSHTCEPQARALTGYSSFECTHSLASVLHKLLLAYVGLLSLFGLLAIYALAWICYRSLRRYSFRQLHESSPMRDVPDLRNDLAFLLHMADQYDPLLAQRLSVFLSPVSETRLLEESLERRWGAARLRSMISVDARGRPALQLVALPRLPPAVFSLAHLEVLKLELVANVKFSAQLSSMTSLRELHLYHCAATVDPAALAVLQEHLEALHLTFTHAAEIPAWVYTLRSLQELHVNGHLGGENGQNRGWALGSLRQLRHLRTLVLCGGLHRIPGELGEVASTLVRLEVHNEGERLLVLTGLRRCAGLVELSLLGCQLERLPSTLMALSSLRGLDLSHNCLRTLEELLGLQHLRSLARLQLAHNRVLVLPASVGALRSLELLDLAHNQLRALPLALFTLRRLRRLLLAGNLLEQLPAEVGALVMLAELDVNANRLEELPPELFAGCTHLSSLSVANNSLGAVPPGMSSLSQLSRLDLRGNSLGGLPAELGDCVGLRGGGLLVEDWLLHSLPSHVREFLQQPTAAPCPRPPSCDSHSLRDSDSFPAFSASQWSLLSALESQI
ncbi:volume-regulated anion channel subunit LRRC8D [Scleropages formosus]|uniref:volume-regulated anion channel subunit LRRC8D n=1 Tax=Scleropages formosus TaxID=113540 RepID=UPI0010FA88A5|nr:volume-regulated anion channel subunit LRRC8D-like [Scleropages formosus]